MFKVSKGSINRRQSFYLNLQAKLDVKKTLNFESFGLCCHSSNCTQSFTVDKSNHITLLNKYDNFLCLHLHRSGSFREFMSGFMLMSQSHAQTLWSMTSAEDCTISSWRTERNTVLITLHDFYRGRWIFCFGAEWRGQQQRACPHGRAELGMLTHADLPIGSRSQWREDKVKMVIWEGRREVKWLKRSKLKRRIYFP